METKQYSLCEAVLRRLHDAGVLDGLVVAGSWCVLFYQAYFDSKNFSPTIRTRDIDLAIPVPTRFKAKVDVGELIDDLADEWLNDLPTLWRSAEAPQLHLVCCRHAATIILADVNLRRPCRSITPHFPDFFNAAGMMAGAPVLRAKDFEQRIQPLVDILEVFA